MTRIKLKMPETVNFTTTLRVRVGDLNYGNHLANDALLSLAHESRVQYFNSLKQSELEFFGSGLIMTDAGVVYKAESFLGDLLTFELSISEIEKFTFNIYYKISKADGPLIANVKTGMAFFDYELKKLVNCPEDFSRIIGKHV